MMRKAFAQQGAGAIITRKVFESHRGDSGCQGAFYTYNAFVQAAGKFPAAGSSPPSSAKPPTRPPVAGQLLWVDSLPGDTAGWKNRNRRTPPYYGRGPIQLTHKYNYEQAGPGRESELGVEQPCGGLRDGHLVLDDAAVGEAVVPRRDHRPTSPRGGSRGTACSPTSSTAGSSAARASRQTATITGSASTRGTARYWGWHKAPT